MFGRKGFGDGTRNRGGVPAATGESQVGASASPSRAASAATPQPDPAPTPTNRLVVGPGLTFDGAITRCDHLVVGGRVVSDMDHCQRMEIAADGSVQGRVTAVDADIAGEFDGELTVLGSLHIRATGRVRGRIAYGTLAIEPGGHLLGIVDSIAEERQRSRPVVVPLRPKKTPAKDRDAAPDNDRDA